MNSKIKFLAVGAGDRGNVYGNCILNYHANDARYVAVAEPVAKRREAFAAAHQIRPKYQFESWEEMLSQPTFADVTVVTTQDQHHLAPTLAALQADYDVLVEKPMASTLADCVTMVQAQQKSGRILQVGHVLRYTDFFSKIYQIVQSGRLGEIITVAHQENVAYWHMAHAFVRGSWRRKDEASPMILAKCCHDLDLLYWILGERIVRLSSTGSLIHFRHDQAPHPDVPPRCTDGCPVAAECPFYAPGIYLEHRPWQELTHKMGLPPEADPMHVKIALMSMLSDGNLEPEVLLTALKEGPYGRCVYHCDNDVVDHQIVLMETESGKSVSLTMHGHSHEPSRIIRIDGTKATLQGVFAVENELCIHDHLTGKTEVVEIPENISVHAGGDEGLTASFVTALQHGNQLPMTSAAASLESHLLAFAAEEARIEGTIIDMDRYRENLGYEF
jgi:predicted dehydrogenase